MARSPTVSIPARRWTRPPIFAALAASALAAAPARADPRPLRVDYEAAEGCPGADVFLDEIRWRTPLARVAAPGEEALQVQARIARRGAVHGGHLVVGQGEGRILRDLEGDRCDEVVSALALITALAIDPHASTQARRAAPGPPPTAIPTPPPAPSEPAPGASPPVPPKMPAPPAILADPLPVMPASDDKRSAPAPALRWALGARAAVALAVVPRPLVGGGLFADLLFAGRWSPSVRVSLEVAGTGSFDVGPGGVWFLRGIGRVDGCAFGVRPAPWLSLVPCLGVEGGALHAQGVVGGSIATVSHSTILWIGAGVLPRIGVDLGSLALDLQGGPIFPAVRRGFVFESPAYVIATLPPVTWTAALGVGAHFP